jgi:succinoglycan biosynthesis protein ExoV
MWPQLLPDFFDENPDELFIGIGSIIGAPYAASAKKIVAGAGYAQSYHSQVPDVHGADWDIFFVRGPRTARLLGIPESLGIGDAATLLRALDHKFRREPRYIGFMPHWESLPWGNWEGACKLAGIRLIDPRAPVEQVIAEILGCEILIAEAMHGAIVADTLRVPWLPVLPIDGAHRTKWLDWADTLGLKLHQRHLWPSSPGEGLKLHQGRLRPSGPAETAAIYRPSIVRHTVSRLAKPFIAYVAAQRLSFLAKRDPCLSADGVTDNTVNRMLEKIRTLERRYKKAG